MASLQRELYAQMSQLDRLAYRMDESQDTKDYTTGERALDDHSACGMPYFTSRFRKTAVLFK